MENNGLSKYTVSFGLSVAWCSLVNALLVVAKEVCPGVQAGMQRLTGSQWVTHAAIVLALFAAFGLIAARAKGGRGVSRPVNRLIKTVVAGILAGTIIIVGFYLIAG